MACLRAELLDFGRRKIVTGVQQLGIKLNDMWIREVNASVRVKAPCLRRD